MTRSEKLFRKFQRDFPHPAGGLDFDRAACRNLVILACLRDIEKARKRLAVFLERAIEREDANA